MRTLGERLRMARELAGLSARALDEAAGLTPGHSAAIESERRLDPNSSTVTALARALGVTTDWLLDGTGSPPKKLRSTGS